MWCGKWCAAGEVTAKRGSGMLVRRAPAVDTVPARAQPETPISNSKSGVSTNLRFRASCDPFSSVPRLVQTGVRRRRRSAVFFIRSGFVAGTKTSPNMHCWPRVVGCWSSFLAVLLDRVDTEDGERAEQQLGLRRILRKMEVEGGRAAH
eukprot:gene182-biopygen15100